MTLGRTRRQAGGSAMRLGVVLLVAGLCGCNGPVEAYRSMTGMNKNDPDPANALYTQNLDQAEAKPYPNLASVPPPPIVDTTLAERQKLAQNLTGTRGSVEANGGSAAPGPVPPAPPIPASLAAAPEAAAPPPEHPPTPVPKRAQDEPPTPQPLNTTMQTPAIGGSLPGLEAARPAPPPGQPSAMPQPAPAALPAATAQSGHPLPPPPPAALPPPQPSPQVAGLPPPRLPPAPQTVIALDIPPGAANVADQIRPRLAAVVARYKDKPQMVRVVAYAAPGAGGAEQLNSFRTALDRAQLVAKELADAGIPSNKIQTQAAPASGDAPTGRIEVQLLP